jgi:hypothetical protein
MIREGTGLFTAGHGEVVPYTGKYAVKTPDVFDRIEAGFARAGLAAAAVAYRPLRIEFELTTKCNDACLSCGMGALSMRDGRTLGDADLDRLVGEFASIGLPSVAVTGGEPFAAMRALKRVIIACTSAGIDVSKLTTNGWWGSEKRCGPTFDALEEAGWLGNRLFVPLLMLSVGEQTVPLAHVARIIAHLVRRYSDREVNLGVSSLADPATRRHRVYDLIEVYEREHGPFPHDRVHSTMRVYLNNERLDDQRKAKRPGQTSLARWMDRCFDCFAPTVGAYVLPTALVKGSGCFYSCAAFNVPEKLAFGNVLAEPLKAIVERAAASGYVQAIRAGGGLRGLHGIVPAQFTRAECAPSFCDACACLIDKHDEISGQVTGSGAAAPLPLIPLESITAGGTR